ncbi:MAG: TerY-C metal binding domain-containing protein [Prevotella sp.]|nr:TerY-C metal binding domain-containing protein [Prevotella sp.]
MTLECPYCRSKLFYICRCGKTVCYHGWRIVICSECGQTGELSAVDETKEIQME